MEFLFNVLAAFISGYFLDWLLESKLGMNNTGAVILSILFGVVVFLLDPASHIFG